MKKMHVFVSVVSVLVLIAMVLLMRPSRTWFERSDEKKVEPWITIFVHGSFGTLIGFLNFSKVFNDQVSGTEYEKIIGKMRDDGFFFRRQPILQRGLVPFDPTINLKDLHHKRLAVYPITTAYQTIFNLMFPDQEKDCFYTFGWSGLLSQTARRIEAIRFYNVLSEELLAFKKKGIHPKIRLICHSHGGNLALNLAAVCRILANPSSGKEPFSSDADENDALNEMAKVIKGLSSKENARYRLGQEVWDYVPTTRDLSVDELILYGVPIQADTECFCYSPFFKRVFNFYSDEDWVQRFDWVSSKKHVSRQRLSRDISKLDDRHIVQARIMVARPVVDGKIVIEVAPPQNASATTASEQKAGVFDTVLEGKGVIARQSNDPTHKELWFLIWDKDTDGFSSPLFPFPVVVLTPLFIAALNNVPEIADADINFDITADALRAHVTRHNEVTIQGGARFPLFYLHRLQKKVVAWQPERDAPMDEFNAIYQYIA